MAEAFAKLLLDAIQTGIQRRQNEAAQSTKDTEMMNEQDAREKAHELALKSYADTHDLAQAQIKELAARVASQHLNTKMAISNAYVQGQVVPGVQSSPVSSGTAGAQMSPVNPQNATSQMLTLPQEVGGEQITVPTPTAYAQQQADLSRITDRPKVEAKIEESRALQADYLKKQEEAKQADFKRAFMQKMWDDSRNQDKIKSEEKIAAGRDATMRFVALQKNAMPDGWEGTDFSPYISDALSGKTSREDFARMALPKPIKSAIEVGVKAAGGNFIDTKQQQAIAEFAPVMDVVKQMDDLLDHLPKNESGNRLSNTAAGLGTIMDQDISSLRGRLEGQATLIGRSISKDNRVSDQDAKRVGQAYFPTPYDKFSNNVAKRNDYVRKVREALDSRLGTTVDPKQRELIKNRLGLNDIPPYEIRQKAPAATPQQVQPGAGPTILNWTPQGLVPAGGK